MTLHLVPPQPPTTGGTPTTGTNASEHAGTWTPRGQLAWMLAEDARLATIEPLSSDSLIGVVVEAYPDAERPKETVQILELGLSLARSAKMDPRATLAFLAMLLDPEEYLGDLKGKVPEPAHLFATAFNGGDGLIEKEDFLEVCQELTSAWSARRWKSDEDDRPAHLARLVDQYLVPDNEVSVRMFRRALWACLWRMSMRDFARPFAASAFLLQAEYDLRLALEKTPAEDRDPSTWLATHGEFTARDADGEGGSQLP